MYVFHLFKYVFNSPEKLLNVMSRDDMREARREKELILIDEDGNVSANVGSPEMKESFARHVAALGHVKGPHSSRRE